MARVTKLPRYDMMERFVCPKCGHQKSKVSYCKGEYRKVDKKTKDGMVTQILEPLCSERMVGDHMHRVCQNCGYVELRASQDASTDWGNTSSGKVTRVFADEDDTEQIVIRAVDMEIAH